MTVAEPELLVESRQEWRDWLATNHASSEGVWVVTWKRQTGRPRPSYEDLVEEAVCFGWIDSSVRSLDEERHGQRMTPRRKRSKWSESNRGRVERLEAEGLMTDAGRAAVERAKLDGTWLSAT